MDDEIWFGVGISACVRTQAPGKTLHEAQSTVHVSLSVSVGCKASNVKTLFSRFGSSDYRSTFWAVADQCAVSGGNFLTTLMLARTLLPAEFGIYALILNAMLFLNNVQQAFVTYPVCVLGARSEQGQFRRMLAFAMLCTTLLVFLFGPTLGAVGASLHRPAVIVASVAAMLLWQLQDTLRAGFIAKLEQRRALASDAVSYVGQAVLLAIVCMRAKPSLNFIFWTIAGTSLIALILQVIQLRPVMFRHEPLRPMFHEFWMLGRWNVVAKLLGFMTLQAFPWVILMRHGTTEVAGFQAMFQMLAFSNPLLFSVGSLITATVAKHDTYKNSSVRNYVFLTAAALGTYLLFLGIAGPSAIRMLYGSHSHYLIYAPLMRIFAAAWVFEVVALIATAILGGLREPQALLFVQLSGTVAAVIIALPWIYWKGLVAAAMGMLLVNVVRALMGIRLVLRHGRRHTSTQELFAKQEDKIGVGLTTRASHELVRMDSAEAHYG
jgi:O-antigen/teichoic acid export membrane protein